jgi:hypothetical protein
MSGKLTMRHFLKTVKVHRTGTREALLDEGYPSKVIYAKAKKAARMRYTDYGVVADRPWLTPHGEAFLAAEDPQ